MELLNRYEIEYTNAIIIHKIIIVSLMGLSVCFFHSLFNNNYLRFKNMLAVAFILPVVTMMITLAISQNFFLALGMIGALSIVRFRTPVKSSYDLVLLFFFITIGIVITVNPTYAYLLYFFILLAPLLLLILSFLLNTIKIYNFNLIDEKNYPLKDKNRIELLVTLRGDIKDFINNKKIKENLQSYSSYTIEEVVENNLIFTFENLNDAISVRDFINENYEIISSSIS